MYTLKEINPARLNNPDAGEKTIFLDQTDSAVKTKNENGLIEKLAVVDENAAPVPLVYKAYLSQLGTSDPTVVVVANTLGGDVVWTRNGVGVYSGTLTGAFPINKVIGPTFGPLISTGIGDIIDTGVIKYFNLYRLDSNSISTRIADTTQNDVDLNGTAVIPIFIEVYP